MIDQGTESGTADASRTGGRRDLRFSLAGKITALTFVVLVLMALLATALAQTSLPPALAFGLTLIAGLILGTWMIGRVLRPVNRTLDSLSDGIRSFHDRDFSVRLPSDRRDELGELARLYNEVAEILREERQEVKQRELLLATALNRSPTAILLVNSVDRIVFSNREARSLFLGGGKLEGMTFTEVRQGCPAAMQSVLETETGGIFSIGTEDQTETYHLSQRSFQINRRRHTLVLLRRLTRELDRKEAEIWKRVIRVISHELRNSLAPVSSFVHSAKKMSRQPQYTERVEKVFDAIEERLDHLTRFIEGYARFARLPKPQTEDVVWADLLQSLEGVPQFSVIGRLPTAPGHFDPAQMRRVLINLLRNAAEADGPASAIEVRVDDTGEGGVYIQVLDRGRGMDEETMRNALLPFYSTKQTGTGLGLPLCREILEAHGGKISLHPRQGGGTVVTCWLPPS